MAEKDSKTGKGKKKEPYKKPTADKLTDKDLGNVSGGTGDMEGWPLRCRIPGAAVITSCMPAGGAAGTSCTAGGAATIGCTAGGAATRSCRTGGTASDN